MKTKKLSLLITLCATMSVFSLTGCGAVADWFNETFPNNKIFNNGGIFDNITGGGSSTTTKYDESYYSTITDSMSGQTLVNALKAIITSGDISTSYSWSRYEQADEDPDNKANVVMIYARTTMKKSDHVNGKIGWNREHTYPKSKMRSPATEDNHIIFASDNVVNGVRSNKKLGVVSSGDFVKDSNENLTPCRSDNNLFDPGDTIARGIVARTTMYAYIMYGYSVTENFSSVSTMMSWHNAYSVSSFEQKRNNIVQKNQHNRNPFVDHPEYAARIWG